MAEGGHLVIKVGRFARATVLLVHDGSATYGQVVEIVLREGAETTVTSIQNWADDTVHLADTRRRSAGTPASSTGWSPRW